MQHAAGGLRIGRVSHAVSGEGRATWLWSLTGPSCNSMPQDLPMCGESNTLADAKQQVKEGATKVQQQAVDKIQALAGDGKAKAGSALDQVAQLLNDAAGQVDEKLGNQYGQYARSAADTVTSLSGAIKDKDVKRGFVTNEGKFVSRKKAAKIALAAGEIKKPVKKLHSSDLRKAMGIKKKVMK